MWVILIDKVMSKRDDIGIKDLDKMYIEKVRRK
jgi:hypothetical protein